MVVVEDCLGCAEVFVVDDDDDEWRAGIDVTLMVLPSPQDVKTELAKTKASGMMIFFIYVRIERSEKDVFQILTTVYDGIMSQSKMIFFKRLLRRILLF